MVDDEEVAGADELAAQHPGHDSARDIDGPQPPSSDGSDGVTVGHQAYPGAAASEPNQQEGTAERADDDAVDSELDRALDDVDGGDAQVRELPPVSGELPLVLAVRERFASLSDIALTGDAQVDAATARLEEIPGLPTPDHVGVYDDVHRRLQDALSDADTH